ncbi:MAG: tRNA (adenosine(37)-N6)-dimethylallyltransferase MiaA, partial [Pseudomonadota bacterium]
MGVLDEVANFRRDHGCVKTSVTGALGYRQFAEFLDGDISLATAKSQTLYATRQYIKRQTTWLRTQYQADFIAESKESILQWLQEAG